MSSITYGAEIAGRSTETRPAGKGWFARAIAALQESRMRQAEREIRQYRHLLPQELEWAGDKISYKNEDSLPFIR